MAEFELNLRDYLRILRRRKATIIFFVGFVALLSFYQSSLQEPVYRSSTTIRLNTRSNYVSMLTDLTTWAAADPVKSAAETIKTFLVAKNAAVLTGAVNEKSTPEEIEVAVMVIQQNTQTEVSPETNLIRIITLAGNPETARKTADALANSYIDFAFSEETKKASQMREFIEKELKAADENMTANRAELKVFMEKGGVPYGPVSQGMALQSGDLGVAQSGGLSAFSSGYSAPMELQILQKRLLEKKVELENALVQYTPKHPQVAKLQQEVNESGAEMDRLLRKLSSQQEEYERLSLTLNINENLYVLLQKKLTEARILESEITRSVEVVNPASLPLAPLSVKKRSTTILGAIIGLVLGLVAAFVRESLDTSILTVDDVEQFMQVPVLAVIPFARSQQDAKIPRHQHMIRRIQEEVVKRRGRARSAEDRSRILITELPHGSPTIEAFMNLDTTIKVATKDKKGEVILITSVTYEEGKSTVAANYALAVAKSGRRVLLIDADLRKPILHKIFEIDREAGLTELLFGTGEKKKIIRGFEDLLLGGLDKNMVVNSHAFDALKIITAGHYYHNTAALLASEKLLESISEFRKEYDVVILDSPPILPAADALILSSRVDHVLLVYQAGRIPRIALRRVKNQLKQAEANILGIVLNNMRAEELEPGRDYYYYYYHDQSRG